MDAFLWRPVLAGVWQQYELRDGTYDFGDLIECHRVLDWRDANRAAAALHQEQIRERARMLR